MKKTIEFDCECDSCKGTGLYQGFAESKGVAVVCRSCRGKGWYREKITYNTTDGKLKRRKDIKLVIEYNPGIGVGENKERGITLKDFGGMSYEDWARGLPFPTKSEMRAFCCPAWWYQSSDYKLKPNWECCPCLGMFTDCKYYKSKEKCWERFDKEQAKGRHEYRQ